MLEAVLESESLVHKLLVSIKNLESAEFSERKRGGVCVREYTIVS